jgi:RNA polymerase-binding protein DksA
MNPSVRRFDGALGAEFRQRLLEARRKLLGTVAGTDEEMAGLEPPGPGDQSDRAAAAAGAELASRLGGQDKHELDEIVEALHRLASGKFGACESCRRAIGLARLRAMPATRFCVRCQTAQEMTPR